jgi:hypothetical protein
MFRTHEVFVLVQTNSLSLPEEENVAIYYE